MPSRTFHTLCVSVTALALATGVSGAATASSPSVAASHAAAAPTQVDPDAKACFANKKPPADYYISSQNFETEYDTADSAGAGDVTLTKPCEVNTIVVSGVYFDGPGPAASETVTFYRDKQGEPGSVLSAQTVTGADDAGTFTIPLTTVKLKANTTYWVAVQVNMDLEPFGQWGWSTSTKSVGKGDIWRNPGNGFENDCRRWRNLFDCFDGQAGPDLIFSLSK